MKKLLLLSLMLFSTIVIAKECECELISINHFNKEITYKSPTSTETYSDLSVTEFKNTLEDIQEWMYWDLTNNQIKYDEYKPCLKLINNELTEYEKDKTIEIYTLENIYYIDVEKLTIEDENGNPTVKFSTIRELSEWIAYKTIDDNKEGYDLLMKLDMLKKYKE